MKRFKAIISYPEIVQREGIMLQRGMNFRANPKYSILLMSVRRGAPYNDKWHQDTGLLEYEGHDVPRRSGLNPKVEDQSMRHPGGGLTQNGKFFQAAIDFRSGERPVEPVQIYEKIAQGVWSDQGRYELVDAAIKSSSGRKVFRFYLRPRSSPRSVEPILNQSRIIPTSVKIQVWRRDGGRCVLCGSEKNLHFDHDIPYSKGGTSVSPKNVRILCAKHNLEKSDKIRAMVPWLIGGLALIAGPSV